MKGIWIFLSVVFVVLSISLSIYFYRLSQTSEQTLNQERYRRMLTEEDLEKSRNKISSLESAINNLSKKAQNVQQILDQTKVSNELLKSNLNESAQAQKQLESKIEQLEKVTQEDINIPQETSVQFSIQEPIENVGSI